MWGHVLQQDFPTTLRHLKSTIRYKCPQCNEGYCLACGEGMPASTGNGGVSKGKGKGKVENGKDKGKGKRKEEIEEIEELLHCANIQVSEMSTKYASAGASMLTREIWIDHRESSSVSASTSPRKSMTPLSTSAPRS